MTDILIIDRNPVLRREALCWATDAGYPTQVVRSLEDAQALLAASHEVIVLVVNVEQAETTAEQVIETLRADVRSAHLPLLLCTRSTQVGQLAMWVLLGADRTQQHPIDRTEFLKALEALSHREQAR